MPPYDPFDPLSSGLSKQPPKNSTIKSGPTFVRDPFPKKTLPPEVSNLPSPLRRGGGAGMTKEQAAAAAILAAAELAWRAIHDAAGHTGNPIFDTLDKLDRKLRGKGKGKPGRPKGGQPIQNGNDPIPPKTGQVPGKAYRIIVRSRQWYPWTGPGNWQTGFLTRSGSDIFVAPIEFALVTEDYTMYTPLNGGFRAFFGGAKVFDTGIGAGYKVYGGYEIVDYVRVDGTSPENDKAQDPNAQTGSQPIKDPSGTTPTTGSKPDPRGIPKRPDGRPDIDDAFDDGVEAIRDFPGWHGGGTRRPSNPTGKPKSPKPDPPVKPKTPKPTPKPSPLPGSPPVVVNPSPPVTDKPTPVPSNPNPSPLPGTIPNPRPQKPTPSKPNPNPGNPGRQPDNPTPQPPTNPTKNPNPDPTPKPYNPSDPAPPPQDPSKKPDGGRVTVIRDRDGSILWREGMSVETKRRAGDKIKGYMDESDKKKRE